MPASGCSNSPGRCFTAIQAYAAGYRPTTFSKGAWCGSIGPYRGQRSGMFGTSSIWPPFRSGVNCSTSSEKPSDRMVSAGTTTLISSQLTRPGGRCTLCRMSPTTLTLGNSFISVQRLFRMKSEKSSISSTMKDWSRLQPQKSWVCLNERFVIVGTVPSFYSLEN